MIVPSPVMRDPITEEDLQSYVDGFLDPVRRAAVEAYLAVNPDESDRIDAYRAQRIGMHVLFDANAPLPKGLAALERRLSRAMTGNRWSWRCFRSAVSVMALVLAAGAGWWASENGVFDGGSAASAWIFVAPHFLMGNEVPASGQASDEESRFVGWLTHNSAADSTPAPDLRALGFNFAGGRIVPTPAGPAVQLTYEDSGSRRIALYIAAARGAQRADITYRQESDGGLLYWNDGSLVYSLTGKMGRDSLLQIAQAIGNGLAQHPDESADKSAPATDFYRAFTNPAVKGQKLNGEKIFGSSRRGPIASPPLPSPGNFDGVRRSDVSPSPEQSGVTRI